MPTGGFTMSINLNTVVEKRIADGLHSALLQGFAVVNNDKGGYIRLDMVFADADKKADGTIRTVAWTVFPGQFDYVFGSLQRQFEKEGEAVTRAELLELAKTTPFNVWKSMHPEYGVNYSLSEPQAEITAQDVEEMEI